MLPAGSVCLPSTAYRNCLACWARVLRPGAAHCSWSPAKLAGEVALRSSQAVVPCWELARDWRRRVPDGTVTGRVPRPSIWSGVLGGLPGIASPGAALEYAQLTVFARGCILGLCHYTRIALHSRRLSKLLRFSPCTLPIYLCQALHQCVGNISEAQSVAWYVIKNTRIHAKGIEIAADNKERGVYLFLLRKAAFLAHEEEFNSAS